MWHNLSRLSFITFYFCLGCAHGLGSLWENDDSKIEKKYIDLHTKFVKEICQKKDPFEFETLVKKYKGSGQYVPEWKGGIDTKTIQEGLVQLEKKKAWITRELQSLKDQKDKDWPTPSLTTTPLKESIKELLDSKKKFQLGLTKEERQKAIVSSKAQLKIFNERFEAMLKTLPFLLNFNFPNDHLKNRHDYDLQKASKKESENHASQGIYFFRKLVEDGAMNPNRTQSDKFTRALLDTLALKIPKQKEFLSENIRYDMQSIFQSVEYHLGQGKAWQMTRLQDWFDRVNESIAFYQKLLEDNAKEPEKTKELIQSQHLAQNALETFVIDKETKTYLFWKEQDDLMKQLYVLETIFANEVGTTDGADGLDRFDVGQIVMNRLSDKRMTALTKKQKLHQKLEETITHEDIEKEKWLNIMFRTGEFSFTYYFIPGVSQIFCPDESRSAKNLRKQNISIALKVLNNPRPEFKASRYFSRESMLGRIDMTDIWKEFKPIPERAGNPIDDQKKYLNRFVKDQYNYLYSFKDPNDRLFQVLDFDGTVLAAGWSEGTPIFFKYRNPHYFIYFQ